MRPLNVLLLLARSQPPHPDKEILSLEELSRATPSGTVHFATTRTVAGLTPTVSRVAFYGDVTMGYQLLGTARFRGFVERGTHEWNIAIQTHELYQYDNIPLSCLGLITVSDVRVESGNIDSLGGVLEDGRRLTVDTASQLDEPPGVTFGTKISSIYFLDGHQGPPTAEETTALLRAKRDELENKVLHLAEKWVAQTQSAKNAREARGTRTEVEEALTSSDDNDLLEPAKPRDIEERFDKLTRGCFSRLDFRNDSHLILRECAAGKEGVWHALGCLNDDTPIRYERKRVESTQHWFEIKPGSGLRIYYRKLHSGDGRLPVVVGKKSEQARRHIPYLKKHDQP